MMAINRLLYASAACSDAGVFLVFRCNKNYLRLNIRGNNFILIEFNKIQRSHILTYSTHIKLYVYTFFLKTTNVCIYISIEEKLFGRRRSWVQWCNLRALCDRRVYVSHMFVDVIFFFVYLRCFMVCLSKYRRKILNKKKD